MSSVLRWENGETEKIKIPILETLAKYYEVNPVWLAGYDVSKYDFNTSTDEQIEKLPIRILGVVVEFRRKKKKLKNQV